MKNKNYLIENGVDVEKSLELFGDIEMYNESMNDFLTDASSKLEKLRDFKAKGDMANYAIEVHALKSDAKYFGFTILLISLFNKFSFEYLKAYLILYLFSFLSKLKINRFGELLL